MPSRLPSASRSEFAVNKLKMLGSGGGAYLLRRSLVDFDSYLLTVRLEVRSCSCCALPALKGARKRDFLPRSPPAV